MSPSRRFHNWKDWFAVRGSSINNRSWRRTGVWKWHFCLISYLHSYLLISCRVSSACFTITRLSPGAQARTSVRTLARFIFCWESFQNELLACIGCGIACWEMPPSGCGVLHSWQTRWCLRKQNIPSEPPFTAFACDRVMTLIISLTSMRSISLFLSRLKGMAIWRYCAVFVRRRLPKQDFLIMLLFSSYVFISTIVLFYLTEITRKRSCNSIDCNKNMDLY